MELYELCVVVIPFMLSNLNIHVSSWFVSVLVLVDNCYLYYGRTRSLRSK